MAAASPQRVFWTTVEEARLCALYPNTPMAALMATFRRSDTAIYRRARVLGLKRSAVFLAGEHSGRVRPGSARGLATRFQAKTARIELA